jgi:hypothetical protein
MLVTPPKLTPELIETIRDLTVEIYELLSEYAHLTIGNGGAECMADSAMSIALGLYFRCGIEGEILKTRVHGMTDYYKLLANKIDNSQVKE